MALVWDHYPRGGGELLTALALADHADHGGRNVRPGIASLARKTRQSERTVQYHLGRMRRDNWLQPERYRFGGYGRATEYRINPEWVSNPANFAPFMKSSIKSPTVQPSADNGAMTRDLGCKIVAPQPSGTVIETTTTAREQHGSVVGVKSTDLVFPPALQGGRLQSAHALITSCPAELQQQVLDEIAGIASKGLLRGSGLGLLRRLVERAGTGGFVPNHGIDYAEKRRRAAETRKALPRLDEQPARNPPSRDVVEQAIATMRIAVSGRRS